MRKWRRWDPLQVFHSKSRRVQVQNELLRHKTQPTYISIHYNNNSTIEVIEKSLNYLSYDIDKLSTSLIRGKSI